MNTSATEDRITRARELGLPTNVEEATRPLLADAGVIRAAIMDVFESRDPDGPRFFFEGHGVPCAGGGYLTVSESMANQERLEFADAVQKRICELQTPPFNLGIKIENYCPRHMRERLPAPTSSTCADCNAELQEKRRINDPD